MRDDSQLIWEAYFDRQANIDLINAVEDLDPEDRLLLLKVWADEPNLQRLVHREPDFLSFWLARRMTGRPDPRI